MSNIKEQIVLRCVKCGAPLPEPKSNDEFIKCEYCGYLQKIIDSQKYVEYLRGEIYKWISEMVPQNVIASPTADPVARHNIFVFNIKPRINGEFMTIKARLTAFLSHPLVYLPYWIPPDVRMDESPKNAYERLVKIDSLTPLAVVDDDLTFFNEIKSTMETYASIVNAFYLLTEKAEITFLVKNFENASVVLESSSEKEVEYKRLYSVYKAYVGIQYFLSGDAKTSLIYLNEAREILTEAIEKAKNKPMLAPIIPSAIKDLFTIECIINLAECCVKYLELGRQSTEFLSYLEKYFKLRESVRLEKMKIGIKEDTSIYKEISAFIKDVVFAKSGEGDIYLLPGRGELLFPLWDVSLTYTFATGVLWAKKGKEVNERLLIAATIPFASQPITDIFEVGPKAGFWAKVKGAEDTLSGGILKEMANSVKKTSLSLSQKVIPPIATSNEATLIANNYIKNVAEKLKGKIKFGVSKVERLVYAPAEIRNNEIYIPALSEALQIKVSPYLFQLLEIAI